LGRAGGFLGGAPPAFSPCPFDKSLTDNDLSFFGGTGGHEKKTKDSGEFPHEFLDKRIRGVYPVKDTAAAVFLRRRRIKNLERGKPPQRRKHGRSKTKN
jgi:hypothetical protein